MAPAIHKIGKEASCTTVVQVWEDGVGSLSWSTYNRVISKEDG